MDKQTIKELEELFTFAPPDSLKQSINRVFFSYLINDRQTFPKEFESIAEDFYFLITFLEQADRNSQNKKSPSN